MSRTIYHIHAYDNGGFYNEEWKQYVEYKKDYYCKNRFLLKMIVLYCKILYDNVVVYTE